MVPKPSLDLTGAIKMFSWTFMLSLTFVEANVIIKSLFSVVAGLQFLGLVLLSASSAYISITSVFPNLDMGHNDLFVIKAPFIVEREKSS